MKKMIFALAVVSGLCSANMVAQAADGILRGITQERPNSSGGTTSSCPQDDANICTETKVLSSGWREIKIHVYTAEGEHLGYNIRYAKPSAANVPNPEEGIVYDVQTVDGVLWCK